MKIDQILQLANKFEKLAQQTEQAPEALDLFFGESDNYTNFVNSLGVLSVSDQKVIGTKSLCKLMADYFNQTNQNVSVNISIEAIPGKGARWIYNINPPNFIRPALNELNKQYYNLTGRTWNQGQADADKAAKQAKSIAGDFKRIVVNKGL